MKVPSKPPKVRREQTPTLFGVILGRLLRHCPGVKAAALIDPEGETVDYAGDLPDYFTKLVSAHFRIVIDDVATRFAGAKLGSPYQVTVRTSVWTFATRRLPEGYALVIIFQRHAFTLSARALVACDDELAREAGWPVAPLPPGTWFPLEVEPSRRDRRRPGRVRVGQRWIALEILGRVMGLQRDRAYRCRLHTGAEVTLVREPSGHWFSEERLTSAEVLAKPPAKPADSSRSPSLARAFRSRVAAPVEKKKRR